MNANDEANVLFNLFNLSFFYFPFLATIHFNGDMKGIPGAGLE